MTRIFNAVPLKGNTDRLPIGILAVTPDGQKSISRDIVYRKMSREDTKLIQDKKFVRNHPHQWMARTICLCVESIDGISVYKDYISSGMKIIPEIVKEIAVYDIKFVFLAGHVFNFGYVINNVTAKCGECEKKQSFDLNIEGLQIDTDYDANFHLISVDLKDGFELEDPVSKQPVRYNKIDFRLPTLGDALRFEVDYRPNDQGMFTEKIYAACTLTVYDENGGCLDPSRVLSSMPVVYKKISAMDSDIIESAINAVPHITDEINETCRNCSEDIPVLVQNGFLFTSRH